jgi:hypothetical protein
MPSGRSVNTTGCGSFAIAICAVLPDRRSMYERFSSTSVPHL